MLFYGLVLLWQGMPSAQLTDGGDMFDICGHTSTRYLDPWRISIGMTGYRQCKICNKPQNITGIVLCHENLLRRGVQRGRRYAT
ncbi:hypothetical protein C8Q72DRAFT_90215 [Fomitopsis betulina]|nr:hypothetical protein C8Q72DRAFT_90215 [Fomitopsis betulina]